MKHEKLSALVDGELNEVEFNSIMEELNSSEVRTRLDLYDKIGDALRAESAKANLSPEFALRMAVSMEAELPLVAKEPVDPENLQGQLKPLAAQQSGEADKSSEEDEKIRILKQLVIPGIAAMAAVAVIFSPQFMFVIQANAYSSSYTAIAGAAVIAQKFIVG
jgi:negative regulator of sigma E activity